MPHLVGQTWTTMALRPLAVLMEKKEGKMPIGSKHTARLNLDQTVRASGFSDKDTDVLEAIMDDLYHEGIKANFTGRDAELADCYIIGKTYVEAPIRILLKIVRCLDIARLQFDDAFLTKMFGKNAFNRLSNMKAKIEAAIKKTKTNA